jgi:hypothetical protein
MGKFGIGLKLFRKTFASASKCKEINLVNNKANKALKTFILNNEKAGCYTEIEAKTLERLENPYLKKFYETKSETPDPIAIKQCMARGGIYISENGDLYYKSTSSMSKKFKVIMRKPFELLNKVNHKAFKRRIARGKYNRNFIQFKPAETVEDAIKFGIDNGLTRRFRGVDINNQSDLELLNTINKALCNVHNKTGGRSIMPRLISIKNAKKSLDGLPACASYSTIMDILSVNRTKKISPFTIYHEMGHANHALNTDLLKILRISEIIARGGKEAKVTSRFCYDNELCTLIRTNMRDYAASSPAEFVADFFAHKIEGTPIHSNKLANAYEALKGPKIIGLG